MKYLLSIKEHAQWRSGEVIPELIDFLNKNVKIESKKIGDKILTILYFGSDRETLLTSKKFIVSKILNELETQITRELGEIKEADLRKTCREFLNSIKPEEHLNEGLKEWATIFATALTLNLVPPQIAKADTETKREWVKEKGNELVKSVENISEEDFKKLKSEIVTQSIDQSTSLKKLNNLLRSQKNDISSDVVDLNRFYEIKVFHNKKIEKYIAIAIKKDSIDGIVSKEKWEEIKNSNNIINEGLKEWATIFATALALNLVPPQIAKADTETKREWVEEKGKEVVKESEKVNPWERKNSKSNRHFIRSVSVGKADTKEGARQMAEKSNLENIQNQSQFILKLVRSEFNLPQREVKKPNIKLEQRGFDENSGVWFRKSGNLEVVYVTQEIEINSIRDWVLKELKNEGIKPTPEFEQYFVDALEKLKDFNPQNNTDVETFINSTQTGSVVTGGTWSENLLNYNPNQKPPQMKEVKPVQTPSHNAQLRAAGHDSKLYKKFFRCGRLRILN